MAFSDLNLKEKIDYCTMVLFDKAIFYGQFTQGKMKSEEEESFVAHTDGKDITFGKLSDNYLEDEKEFGFVLAHELLHIILGHCCKELRSQISNFTIANICQDIVINSILSDSKTSYGLGKYDIKAPKVGIHPEISFSDSSWLDLYNQAMKQISGKSGIVVIELENTKGQVWELPPIFLQPEGYTIISSLGQSAPKGDSEESINDEEKQEEQDENQNGNGEEPAEEEGEEEQEEGDKEEERGENEIQENEIQENEIQENEIQENEIQENEIQENEIQGVFNPNNELNTTEDEILKEMTRAETICQLSDGRGGLDSELERLIGAYRGTKVNWKEVLRSRLKSFVNKKVSSYTTPKKTLLHRGIILPDRTKSKAKDETLVNIYWDTSGSMTSEQEENILAEFRSLVKKYKREGKIWFWDHELYEPIDLKSVTKGPIEIEGRGGNDFGKVAKSINEQPLDILNIVVTDGYYATNFDITNRNETVWLICGRHWGGEFKYEGKGKNKIIPIEGI